MPQAFPVQIVDFFDAVGVVSATFHLPDIRTSGETGGGEIITMDTGSRLWKGSFSVSPKYTDEADEAQALGELLLQSGASFLITDGRKRGPRYDPNGAILGASTPTISAISADRREISIAGLPSGYILQTGDLVSFVYGGVYALHRVYGTRTANGSGNMSALEVIPAIRTGATAGANLTLIDPVCKAVVNPGSFQPQQQNAVITGGFSLEWTQTLK